MIVVITHYPYSIQYVFDLCLIFDLVGKLEIATQNHQGVGKILPEVFSSPYDLELKFYWEHPRSKIAIVPN